MTCLRRNSSCSGRLTASRTWRKTEEREVEVREDCDICEFVNFEMRIVRDVPVRLADAWESELRSVAELCVVFRGENLSDGARQIVEGAREELLEVKIAGVLSGRWTYSSQ